MWELNCMVHLKVCFYYVTDMYWVNPHSEVALMSRKSLLGTSAIFSLKFFRYRTCSEQGVPYVQATSEYRFIRICMPMLISGGHAKSTVKTLQKRPLLIKLLIKVLANWVKIFLSSLSSWEHLFQNIY